MTKVETIAQALKAYGTDFEMYSIDKDSLTITQHICKDGDITVDNQSLPASSLPLFPQHLWIELC